MPFHASTNGARDVFDLWPSHFSRKNKTKASFKLTMYIMFRKRRTNEGSPRIPREEPSLKLKLLLIMLLLLLLVKLSLPVKVHERSQSLGV